MSAKTKPKKTASAGRKTAVQGNSPVKRSSVKKAPVKKKTTVSKVASRSADTQNTSQEKTRMGKDLLNASPIHLLHRAGQCAGDIFSDEMTSQSLTPRQYAVLLTVAENEGLSQTGLVERTGIDRSTLADIIRRMLKKGLINRKRTKEDARAYAVKLTAKGRRVLEAASPAASLADQRILDALPKSKRQDFLNSLQIIVENISQLESRSKK